MKRTYIIPNTATVAFQSGLVCQVASVHGKLGFGGEDDNFEPI